MSGQSSGPYVFSEHTRHWARSGETLWRKNSEKKRMMRSQCLKDKGHGEIDAPALYQSFYFLARILASGCLRFKLLSE